MHGKTALVTGASEGIGRAFAARLAADGWQLTVVARAEARLASLVAAMPGRGHAALPADLARPEGVAAVVERLRAHPVQLLVNNAGCGHHGDFHAAPVAAHEAILRLNVDALVALAHAFLRSARRGDALVNVSSALAFLPLPGAALYSGTKALVTALSEALWEENRGRDVYVLGLCPGVTRTEFARRAGSEQQLPPAWLQQTPAQVVAVALRALAARRRPTAICGELNAVAAGVPRLLPRRAVVRLLGRATGRRRGRPATAPAPGK